MSRLDGRAALADLRVPIPAIYWTDLGCSAGFGWAAFALAVAVPPWRPLMLAATTAAIFLLYRALCFTHEISHNRSRLPG